MSYFIALTKKTKEVTTATDPNDFIFHSDYNTFKILGWGVKTCVLTATTTDQVFTEAHAFTFIPLVTAFAKNSAKAWAFPPNSEEIDYYYGGKAGWITTGVKFKSIYADIDNITFEFDNTSSSAKTIYVRYFCIEAI